MSRPPLNPDKTIAGIALDPRTLERVVPESKRPDGSVRKQLKIRPGFTPQEDVKRFRGTKQAQLDANQLPKGHIIGWVPPTAADATSSKPMSKGAKKNAKKKAKKEEERAKAPEATKEPKAPVPDNWEDDEDEAPGPTQDKETVTPTTPPTTSPAADAGTPVEDLTTKLETLKV